MWTVICWNGFVISKNWLYNRQNNGSQGKCYITTNNKQSTDKPCPYRHHLQPQSNQLQQLLLFFCMQQWHVKNIQHKQLAWQWVSRKEETTWQQKFRKAEYEGLKFTYKQSKPGKYIFILSSMFQLVPEFSFLHTKSSTVFLHFSSPNFLFLQIQQILTDSWWSVNKWQLNRHQPVNTRPVAGKKCLHTVANNSFGKYWTSLIICSLLQTEIYCDQVYPKIYHQTRNLLVHYLVKWTWMYWPTLLAWFRN